MNKIISLLLSILLIISAFFVGYFFASKSYEKRIQEIENSKYKVDITTSKTGIDISKSSKKIDIFIDKKLLEGTGSIIK